MKVLILTPYDVIFTNELVANLKKQHIAADGVYYTENKIVNSKEKVSELITGIKFLYKIPVIRSLIKMIYLRRWLNKNAYQYDAINFHFCSYLLFILYLWNNRYGHKTVMSIWGSDIYKAGRSERYLQHIFFKKVAVITLATESTKKDFIGLYGEKYVDKFRYCRFGIGKFEDIISVMHRLSNTQIKQELNLPLDKIIVSCGYNGLSSQQHEAIITALSELPACYKKKLFLYFQMIKGDNDYVLDIRSRLDELGLAYLISETLLSEEQVVKYRVVTDIMINMQKTDLLSASVQEHICARNIVLVGEWLPYAIFEEHDIFFIRLSINEIPVKLQDVIERLDIYKKKSSGNTEKICDLNSWKNNISSYISVYREVGT